MQAVRLVTEGNISYREVARQLGIRNKSQVVVWVKRYREGQPFKQEAPRKGRPKTKFTSVEEEMAYLRAEIEYLKKRLSKSTRGVTSKSSRYEIVEEMRLKYPLGWLLKLAEVSRAGYYKWRKRGSHLNSLMLQEKLLEEHIMAIHRLHPYFGYLRMTVAMKREGLHVNHKRVYRLMKKLGIRSVIRKKRRFFGKQASVVHPNRLERQFHAEAPLRKLVTDITYIRVGERFVYLSAIQDLYNNEVVAWRLSERNDLLLVTKTVDMLCEKTDLTGVLLHSDQGFQYTSKPFNSKLTKLGIVGSHSRRGNCFDNACIESFFSHLKTEKIYLTHLESVSDLEQAIQEYVSFYNHERFQKKLNDRSPVEYRETVAA
ncbi:IS3 family transposase [Paenibacillus urinalis]|uniref:IS3 family transposase n=4 Tax=Paenibacillus TaxID=44249 RepID=A0AAX3N637_9BACL|nr:MULTISPECIES: IS3 family transposase [Paenibacillus]WDH85107.1 IS3 family transposase [Paenibacillus urinalis]WDH99906.1 IS3 family transposase [Paenibacillus urinalis]WDI04734.1 IS3 family transposase [Paenibacillus urinalis]